MEVRFNRLGTALLTAASFALPSAVQADDDDARRLEEVVVTAERRESSVQDTSISITAFTSEMMDDFGIRNQSDLQNLVPATTIQPYDSAVRGVGRAYAGRQPVGLCVRRGRAHLRAHGQGRAAGLRPRGPVELVLGGVQAANEFPPALGVQRGGRLPQLQRHGPRARGAR